MQLTTEVITLTPHLAADFLSKSKGNRPTSRSTIDLYSNKIKRGEWMLNGEPINFDVDGALVNGHHRCLSVIQAKTPINVLVVRGCDRDSFKTYDQGKRRNVADALGIAGEINTNVLAAAIRAHFSYFVPSRVGCEASAVQLFECLKENPAIRFWAQKYVASKPVKRRFPAPLAGLLAVASARYGTEKMEVFFDQLETGIGLTAGDPALLLRERFADAKAKSLTMSRKQQDAFIIKAINAFIQGRKIGVLRLKSDEEMPRLV